MILDIRSFSRRELIRELLRRENEGPVAATPRERPHPYSIMKKMYELGWKEDPRKGYSDKKIDRIWDYVGFPNYTDDDSWCAASMNACLKLCGYETSDKIPLARSFANYGEEIKVTTLQPGYIAVFARPGSSWRGHVGFVNYTETQRNTSGSPILNILGGNQNNAVTRKFYPIHDKDYRLIGIRKITDAQIVGEPDWKTLKEWRLL